MKNQIKTIDIAVLANVTGGAGAPVSAIQLQNALLDPYRFSGSIAGRPVSASTINSVIRPK